MSAPRQIIMLRHGQSEANLDQTIYDRIPDYRIPLTELGISQAKQAGERIRQQLAGEKVCIYVSPYLRAYQTLEVLGLEENIDRVFEEPRLREQDWANFQNPEDIAEQKDLRNSYGHFFYRFRDGESGSDVYDRICSFLETLYRHWGRANYAPNTLLITHGLTMRLFCMRWFHWSVEYFESLNNPGNAEIRSLIRQSNGHHLLRPGFQQWKDVAPRQTVLDSAKKS